MWLLDTTTLELKHVVSGTECKYAILSHTWGEKEVLFQDMKTKEARRKPGWAKVTGACRTARYDGYSWIWIDTVCVNKESSTELSEAINSMWLYYYQADLCYAYLSDVDEGCPELHSEDDWMSGFWQIHFSAARWFSRGWTLQELIAPRHVRFYNCQWGLLGSKYTLNQPLSNITGVNEDVLENSITVPSYTIARRMSWAAHRVTSREEDRAYSLLGIFNVNIPLIYGEGHRAFVRLQEKIIETSTDHSVFAWEYAPDEIFPHDDLIFAKGPHQFSHAAKMIRQRGELLAVDLPYRLTNRGLQFDGLSMFQTGDEWFAVLNCRYEDNLKGPVALRLYREDDHSRSLPALYHQDDYWPRIFPFATAYSLVSVKRTMVIDQSRSLVATRTLNLLRFHPEFAAREHLPSYPKIWLCDEEASPIHFDIIDTYPPGHWNVNTGVLCCSSLQVTTSIKIRDRRGNTLVVGVRLIEDSIQDLQREEFGRVSSLYDVDLWLQVTGDVGSTSCQKICEFLDDLPMHDRCEAAEASAEVGHALYRVHVGPAQRMGDRVYEIRISRNVNVDEARNRREFWKPGGGYELV